MIDKKIQEGTSDPWMLNMLNGDFESAWKVSDEVLKLNAGKSLVHLPRHLQNIWKGSSLEGKRVLVRCYHGLGDTIQFIRYMPLLKRVASRIIVWAQSSLIQLLHSVEGIDEILPLHDGSPNIDFDVDIEVMELPYIFRTTLHTIPKKIPYLQVEPMPLSINKKKISVGIIWKAGVWDEDRSVPFSFLAPLAELENINFIILQSNIKTSGWHNGFGMYPGEFSLFDYARVIKSLDLLITVDSMPAHMAGALGVPVWVVLKKNADWRWMKDRYDSPWYPTMRLFRQEEDGDWKTVIQQVTNELSKLTNNKVH